MTIIKNSFNLESLIEFTRRGVSLDMEEALANPIASPDTLLDILTTPGTLIPSVLSQAVPDNDLLTEKDFLFCEPLAPLDIVPQQRCDVCVKNPVAFVEDWETKENNFIFFNPRDCTYSVTVETNTFGIPEETTIKLYISLGVERLLRHYKKSDTITAVMYIPVTSNNYDVLKDEVVTNNTGNTLTKKYKAELIAGNVIKNIKGVLEGDALFSIPPAKSGYRRIIEDFDSVEQVSAAAEKLFDKTKHIFVSTSPGQRTKLLINVPVDILDAVPLEIAPESNLRKQLDTTNYETPFEVTISGQEYIDIFSIVSRNIKRASKYMGELILKGDEGTLYTNVTVFGRNGEITIEQKPHFVDFENKSTLLSAFEDKYVLPLMNYSGILQEDLEFVKINIERNENNLSLKVKEITFKKYGCQPVKMSELKEQNRLIADLFAYDDDIVIGYVAKLPSMKMYLEGQEDINWIEFLTKFTYPGLTIKNPEVFANGEGEDEILRCMAENTLENVVEMLMQKFVELPNLFLGSLTKNICSTASEFRNNYNETSREINLISDKIRRLQQEADSIRERRRSLKSGPSTDEVDKINQTISDTTKKISELEAQIGTEFGPEFLGFELGNTKEISLSTVLGAGAIFSKFRSIGDQQVIDNYERQYASSAKQTDSSGTAIRTISDDLKLYKKVKEYLVTNLSINLNNAIKESENKDFIQESQYPSLYLLGQYSGDSNPDSYVLEVIKQRYFDLIKQLETIANVESIKETINLLEDYYIGNILVIDNNVLTLEEIFAGASAQQAQSKTIQQICQELTQIIINDSVLDLGIAPGLFDYDTILIVADAKAAKELERFSGISDTLRERRKLTKDFEKLVYIARTPGLLGLYTELDKYKTTLKTNRDKLEKLFLNAKDTNNLSFSEVLRNKDDYSIESLKRSAKNASNELKKIDSSKPTGVSSDVSNLSYGSPGSRSTVNTDKKFFEITELYENQKLITEEYRKIYENAFNRYSELERIANLDSTENNIPSNTLEKARQDLLKTQTDYNAEKQNLNILKDKLDLLTKEMEENSSIITEALLVKDVDITQFDLRYVTPEQLKQNSYLILPFQPPEGVDVVRPPGGFPTNLAIPANFDNNTSNSAINTQPTTEDIVRIYRKQLELMDIAIKERKQEIKSLRKQFREAKKDYINNFERKGIEFRRSLLTQLDKEQKGEKPLLELILRLIFPTTEEKNRTIGKNKLEGVFKALNGGGGWCAWVQLLLDASKCVMNGLGLEDAKEAIIRSLLKSVTPFEFQKLLRNFPAGLRERLRSQLQTSIPGLVTGAFPWDYKYPGTGEYSEDDIMLDEPLFKATQYKAKVKKKIDFDFQQSLDAQADLLFDFSKPEEQGFDPNDPYKYLKNPDRYRDETDVNKKLQIFGDTIAEFLQNVKQVNEYLSEWNLFFPTVQIIGHTDPISDDNYNQKLSERRATVVYNYLLKECNFDANLITYSGKGEKELKIPNSPDTRTQGNIAVNAPNRRVEFKIDRTSFDRLKATIIALNLEIDAYNAEEAEKEKAQNKLYGDLKNQYELDLKNYQIQQAALKDPEFQKLLRQAEKERRKQDVAENLKNYQLENSQNLGLELGNIQKTIIDATIDYLIESVGVNTLFEYLKNMPGMTLATKFITDLKCLIPPLPNFDPKWDNFLKTTKFNICHFSKKFGRADITMPKMKNNKKLKRSKSGEGNPTNDLAPSSAPKPRVKDLFLVLSQKISDTILDIATQLLVKVIVSLVEKSLDLLCNLVGDFAANLVALFQQNNDVKEQLKRELCPEDVSDEQFANGMKNILDGLYSSDPTRKDCVSSLTNQDLLGYIESLLVVLNYGQIYDLMSGNATANVLSIASKIASTSTSGSIRCIFSNPDSIQSYFKGVGLLTNIRDILQAFPENLQLTEYASVCPPNTIDSLNQFRTNLLTNRGLTDQQIQDQLELYKQTAQKKLEDLFKYMQDNPLDELLDMLYPNSTSCPTNALVIAEPDEDFAVDQELEAVFGPIEGELERDLVGPHGVMQHVLSDTNGKKYSIHRFLVEYFGSPLGEMARGVSFYSDNMIIPSDKLRLSQLGLNNIENQQIIDAMENSFFMSSKKRDRIDSLGNRVFAADGEAIFTAPGGGFPLTVGGHLLNKLQNLEIGYAGDKKTLNEDKLPKLTFKTRKVTIQDKFLREQEIEYNKIIVDMRKEYVAKFAIVSGMVLAEVAAPYIKERLDEYTLKSPFTLYRTSTESMVLQNNIMFQELIQACEDPTLFSPVETTTRKNSPKYYLKKLFSYIHAADRFVDIPVLFIQNNGVTDSENRYGVNGTWLIDVVSAEGFNTKNSTNFGYGAKVYNQGNEYIKSDLSSFGTYQFNGKVQNSYSTPQELPSQSRELYDIWNVLLYGNLYDPETGTNIATGRNRRNTTEIIQNELKQIARFTKEVAFPNPTAFAANTEASQTGLKFDAGLKETQEEEIVRKIWNKYGSKTWSRQAVLLGNIQKAYDPNSKQQIIDFYGLSKTTTDLQVLDFLNERYGSTESVKLRTPLSPLTDINPFELGFSYLSYRKPVGMFQGNRRELTSPDYGFDLTYDFNIQNTGSLELDPAKKNTYRVVLTETINPLNDPKLENRENAAYRDYYRVAKNLSYLDDATAESLQPPLVVVGGSYSTNQVIKFDKEISSTPSQEVSDYVSFLETKVNDRTITYSYELESFIRYMIERFDKDLTKSGAIANDLIKEKMLDFDSKQKLKDFFDNINEGFSRRITNRIGFSDESPEITFEETQYSVYPNEKDINYLNKLGQGDGYQSQLDKVIGALKEVPILEGSDSVVETGKEKVYVPNGFRFGWDLNVEPQIQFLDPLAFGSPENQNPFYIKPPAYKGWLGLLQAVIPEGDACEPARIPLNSFDDIKAEVQQIKGQFKKDDRLNFDPFCTTESPYDKMQDQADLAMMDGIIKATCRTYILETALRMVPILSEFKLKSEDNFDELLEIYISERMLNFMKTMDSKRRFKAKGRKVLRDELSGKLSVTNEKYPMLTYYYGMLEQAVSLIIKKIDAGIIDINTLSVTQATALRNIRSKIEEYYILYAGTEAALTDEAIQAQTFFNKVINKNAVRGMSNVSANYVALGAFNKLRAKRIKQSISYMTLLESEEDAKTLFSIYIKEQLDKISVILDDKFKPKVEKIDYLFMSDPKFINGAVTLQRNQISGDIEAVGGPYDVMGDTRKPETFTIDMSKFTDNDIKPYNVTSEYRWPFVLESYIIVDDKNQANFSTTELSNKILNREENLFKITNMKDWQKFINSLIANDYSLGSLNISDLFGPGLSVLDQDPESLTFGQEVVKNTGLKFGLRMSMVFDDSDLSTQKLFGNVLADCTNFANIKDVQENKAYRLDRNKEDGSKETIRLVPLVSAELDVKNQKLRDFNINQYDLICLINKMVKSTEFKTLFRYVFPYRRYLSLMSMYVSNSFFDSIGNMGTLLEGGDKWTVPGGRRGSSFRKWDKEYIFDNRERTFHGGVGRELMTTFLAYYKKLDEYDNQRQRNKRTNRFQTENITKELMDLIPKDFLDSIPWWLRRNRVDRPYDMFDNECPEFDDLDPGEPF